jgi:hypothetical protein
VSIGNNLDEGEKIEAAISGLGGTSVANIEPTRQDHKVKTIKGITKLFYFRWPVTGNDAGYIQAQCLPHIGEVLQFSPSEIASISKPSPQVSSYSVPEKTWNFSLSNVQGNKYELCIYVNAHRSPIRDFLIFVLLILISVDTKRQTKNSESSNNVRSLGMCKE